MVKQRTKPTFDAADARLVAYVLLVIVTSGAACVLTFLMVGLALRAFLWGIGV